MSNCPPPHISLSAPASSFSRNLGCQWLLSISRDLHSHILTDKSYTDAQILRRVVKKTKRHPQTLFWFDCKSVAGNNTLCENQLFTHYYRAAKQIAHSSFLISDTGLVCLPFWKLPHSGFLCSWLPIFSPLRMPFPPHHDLTYLRLLIYLPPHFVSLTTSSFGVWKQIQNMLMKNLSFYMLNLVP